jgi:hypothetical protein
MKQLFLIEQYLSVGSPDISVQEVLMGNNSEARRKQPSERASASMSPPVLAGELQVSVQLLIDR